MWFLILRPWQTLGVVVRDIKEIGEIVVLMFVGRGEGT